MVRSNKIVKILSVDGGGIRGIIPLVILEYLRSQLIKKGINDPFYRLFDVIAGTSTGGIIALALSSPNRIHSEPMSINQLLSFYENKSSYIFENEYSPLYKAFMSLFKPPYNPSTFEKELLQIFGDETLKDLLTDVYVTTLNIITYETKNFLRIPKSSTLHENFYVRDVARATSAAPTLFPPAQVQSLNSSSSYCLVDGGFYAVNPSLNAYLYAKSKYPLADKYVLISLGTGLPITDYSCKEIKNWGLGSWVAPWKNLPLVQSFMQGQIHNANDLLRSYCPDLKFFRFEPLIEPDEDSASDASVANIINLEKIGIDYVKKNSLLLAQAVNALAM